MSIAFVDTGEYMGETGVANKKTLCSAGFFTGGSLAFRGGVKAARNNAIGCAVLLAVIEGVGIAFGKMMAGSTKLEMPQPPPNSEVQAL